MLLATACSSDTVTPKAESFTSVMTTANEVPVKTGPATGTAVITVNGTKLDYTIDVANITAVTAAHIHAGNAATAGGIVVLLFAGPTTGAITTSTRLATGSVAADSFRVLSGGTAKISMDSLLVLMRSQNAYVNVHTTANPGGEIRGQTVKNP